MPIDFGFVLFMVIIVIMVGGLALSEVVKAVGKSQRNKRGVKMIEAAKRLGCRFCCNWDHDVLAMCTWRVFQEGLAEHNRKVNVGEAKEWDKVVCYAKPVFTFAGSEQTLRPAHTGLKSELDSVADMMMKSITGGISKSDVSLNDYDKAMGMIFVRDSRLFVPYAGSPSDGEKQFAFYGKTTMAQAHQALKL